jgi:hypothetical protein
VQPGTARAMASNAVALGSGVSARHTAAHHGEHGTHSSDVAEQLLILRSQVVRRDLPFNLLEHSSLNSRAHVHLRFAT